MEAGSSPTRTTPSPGTMPLTFSLATSSFSSALMLSATCLPSMIVAAILPILSQQFVPPGRQWVQGLEQALHLSRLDVDVDAAVRRVRARAGQQLDCAGNGNDEARSLEGHDVPDRELPPLGAPLDIGI